MDSALAKNECRHQKKGCRTKSDQDARNVHRWPVMEKENPQWEKENNFWVLFDTNDIVVSGLAGLLRFSGENLACCRGEIRPLRAVDAYARRETEVGRVVSALLFDELASAIGVSLDLADLVPAEAVEEAIAAAKVSRVSPLIALRAVHGGEGRVALVRAVRLVA